MKDWFKALLWSVLILIFLKGCIGFPHMISGTSMNGTLLQGDIIFINKLKYGPRFPITPLSIPFMQHDIPFTDNLRSYLDWIQLPYYRLPGYSEPSINDIIVFNYPLSEEPIDHKTQFVKRCYGTPGDTIQIIAGKITVNNDTIQDSELVTHEHLLTSKNLTWDTLNQMGITEGGEIGNFHAWSLMLNKKQIVELKEKNLLTSIVRVVEYKGDEMDPVFPFQKDYQWTLDEFGPIIIPSTDDSVNLDTSNYHIYEHILKTFEKQQPELVNGEILLNGEVTNKYLFKQNYYFVIGDNRHNSNDSRLWGFVPESHIIGFAGTILFSINKQSEGVLDKIRWSRTFNFVQ